MILSNASRTLIIVTCGSVFSFVAASAGASEDSPGSDHHREPNGKAAAHAALEEKAGIPVAPPQLPDQASDQARAAVGATGANGAIGKTASSSKGDAAAHRAQDHGRRQLDEDAKTAHVDATDRAAQGAVASAVRNANADSHAAAGQARAAAAKARAAQHEPAMVHPVPGPRP